MPVNVRVFTHPEIDALEEYDDQVPLPAYFDLETLLGDTDDPAGAFRQRAEELTRWHDALARLLTDPRLKNTGNDGQEPYSPAPRCFLKGAAGDYHRHRHGYAVTVWALGLPDVSPHRPPRPHHFPMHRASRRIGDPTRPARRRGLQAPRRRHRVHRYTCTIHDGQGCDGHCGPLPADPPENQIRYTGR
ncbi:hypothetical protein ACFYYM_35785 [Streptomyces erythrochromogenes]|uniref:hypothetical protein n=1 Tax=Streptomyces erythrochromogenes TaxID=285574 RepID=UPI00368B5BC9